MILNYLILKLYVLIDFAGCNKQSNICVEYVDAFLQVIQDVCDIGIQTQINEYENKGDYNKLFNGNCFSNKYYGNNKNII